MRILSWSIDKKDQLLSIAELESDLTVVLASDEAAKTAFLRFVEQVLPGSANGSGAVHASSWTGHLVLGTARGPCKLEPSRLTVAASLRGGPPAVRASKKRPGLLCIRAADTSELATLDSRSIAERLLGPAGASGRATLESLRARAESFLPSNGGRGRIADLIARLASIDAGLGAARECDGAGTAEVEALLGGDDAAGLARERGDLAAQRGRVAALLRLWPSWQDLSAASAELASIEPAAPSLGEAEPRLDALQEGRVTAENHCRILRARLAQLRHDLEGVRTKEALSLIGEEARCRAEELAAYRDRLLKLAAARARLSELEAEIAAAPGNLGPAWDVSLLARFAAGSAAAAELADWQRRIGATRAAWTAAARDRDAAREKLDDVCTDVAEHLAAEPAGEQDEIDSGWRALWRLRANLEEVWLVRSRAESRARTLQDREAALGALESSRHWIPPARLGDLLSLIIVVVGGCFVARAMRHDFFDAALLAVATLTLLGGRLAMHARTNWTHREQRKMRAGVQKLRGEVHELRDGRDADWKRAALLDEAIRTDGARLGFTGVPAPEAVDQCEQELARRLRTMEARTPLSALLRRLLDVQDEEQGRAATFAAAEEVHGALVEDWEAWRAAAGLPDGADPDLVRERLRRLGELSDTIASRDAVRAEMLAMEPEIAAWEESARRLLARVGVEIPVDLCGKALATEIGVLHKRVERNDERERRRASLEGQIRATEEELAEAEGQRDHVGAEWAELVSSAGAGSEEELHRRIAALRRRGEVERRVAELEGVIAASLAPVDDPLRVRTELATGAVERWEEELRQLDLQRGEIETRLVASDERWRAAAPSLARARKMEQVPDLLLEREQVLAALASAVREWRLLVIARGLVEESIEERESARRREILGSASGVLAGLSGGSLTAIIPDGKSGGLALIRQDGSRVLADGKLDAETLGRLYLSIRLGHAAHLASHGKSLPVILDDVLAPLSPADAATAAREIAATARGNQVLYLTIDAAARDELTRAAGVVQLLRI